MPYSTHPVGLIEIEEHLEPIVFDFTSNNPETENASSTIATRQDLSGTTTRSGTSVVCADLDNLTLQLQRELNELLDRILAARLRGRLSPAS